MINVILTTLGPAGNKSYNHPCNAGVHCKITHNTEHFKQGMATNTYCELPSTFLALYCIVFVFYVY